MPVSQVSITFSELLKLTAPPELDPLISIPVVVPEIRFRVAVTFRSPVEQV
jgi:hypothetical protein